MHTQLFSQILTFKTKLHYMNVIHDQRCFLGIVFVAIIPMTPTPTKKPTAHP